MKKLRITVGLFFLLLAAFVAWQAWGLRYYTRLGPGPGFFPLWLAMMLGLVSLLVIVDAMRAPAGSLPRDFFPDRQGLLRIGAIILAIVAAIYLLQPLGFRITMLLLYLFVLYAMGRRDITVMALIALAGSFGAYQLFYWLDVRLPVGFLGI